MSRALELVEGVGGSWKISRRRVRFIIAFSSVFGALVFWSSGTLALLLQLSTGLVTLTGATFAIIGVWLTLLNPLSVLDREEEETGKAELIAKLEPFFKLSILTFAGAVSFRLLAVIVPAAAFTTGEILAALYQLLLGTTLSVPEVVTSSFASIIRTLAGSFVILLFILQIAVILANLLPLFDADAERENRSLERSLEANRPKPRNRK